MSYLLCIDNVCTRIYTIGVRYKGYKLEYSEEKNILLKETRNIGFEEILLAIEENGILDDLKHPNKKYKHQRILVVKQEDYVYAIPYVIDQKRKAVFLKTVYPSRFLTSKYRKGGVKK